MRAGAVQAAGAFSRGGSHPPKTCTYDCLYCQVGRTTEKTVERRPFVPVEAVISDLEAKLAHCSPDAITLAGSGEPTLHSDIERVIDAIHERSDTRVVVLTNGSLFCRESVRCAVLKADLIMPTLTSAHKSTFERIHRPHEAIDHRAVVDGLMALRREYAGPIFLETVFLNGINDTDEEVEALGGLISKLNPERIQLNTVVRPPADGRAKSLDRTRLEAIKLYFGKRAEIVADTHAGDVENRVDAKARGFLEMVRRRPLRRQDAATSLGLSVDEVEELVKGFLIKGFVRQQTHAGEIFYLSNEDGN
ncbi:MAG: radical SAM protein [Deltaproteobacteria bacterium]|nr:radical SAM protein [Deltaproteobacteria bacterium]